MRISLLSGCPVPPIRGHRDVFEPVRGKLVLFRRNVLGSCAVFDRFADFDDLRSAGPRVCFDLPAFRPAVGVVVMSYIAQQ